jgi:hypothetical protein
MSTRCKPGDLAYLSSDCVDSGVIVEVLRAGPAGEDGPAWHCQSRTPINCVRERTKAVVLATDIVVADRYLRPITGLPLTDDIPQEREVVA